MRLSYLTVFLCLSSWMWIILMAPMTGFAQFPEEDTTNYLHFSNQIFRDNIKTVQFHRAGWDLSPPLMELNSNEQLLLSFDDLEADGKEYTFTIVHCNHDWTPSDLEPYEYIDGYEEDYIYQFRYSVNTIVPYTHYELLFPTPDLKPEISGNFMLKVYLDREDSLYFTRRFMVLEQKVDVQATVRQATRIDDKKFRQEVDFEILASGYSIPNPYRNLSIVIQQNGRWDNARFDIQPKMVVGDKLNYDYDGELVFDGGNEFRSIDIKSLTYNTENVDKINYDRTGYHVFLRPDKRRTFQVYKTENDINGQFKIKTEDQVDTETRSEYVQVHFFLPYDVPLMDADIYIQGALTGWTLNEHAKMNYDLSKRGFIHTLLLKQGYYNYQYVALQHGQQKGDVAFIEGNHWETKNEYTVLVYHREQGDFYDRLVGVTHVNSFADR